MQSQLLPAFVCLAEMTLAGTAMLIVIAIAILGCATLRKVLGLFGVSLAIIVGLFLFYGSLQTTHRERVVVVHSNPSHAGPTNEAPPALPPSPVDPAAAKEIRIDLAALSEDDDDSSDEAQGQEDETADENGNETQAENDNTVDDNDDEQEQVEAEEAASSSVANTTEPRPDWVDAPPKRIGNVERWPVSSGPWTTLRECETAITTSIMDAVREYMRSRFEADVGALKSVGVTEQYVRNNICTRQFIETTQHDFGNMKTLHVLMEFNPSVRRYLEASWLEHQRRQRIHAVSLGGGGVLGLLALIYGLLRIDTWTKGYYSKRLFIGVPAALAGLGLLVALVS